MNSKTESVITRITKTILTIVYSMVHMAVIYALLTGMIFLLVWICEHKWYIAIPLLMILYKIAEWVRNIITFVSVIPYMWLFKKGQWRKFITIIYQSLSLILYIWGLWKNISFDSWVGWFILVAILRELYLIIFPTYMFLAGCDFDEE